MKKETAIKLVLLTIFTIGSVIFIYNSKEYKRDKVKFKEEYPQVQEDNVFVYKTGEEIVKILKNGTGVVYLGFPECPWCQEYVKHISEVAKTEQVDKIYYFNILEDRKNNTKVYKEIVALLKEKLLFDKEGNERIYVPDLTVVKNGKIIFHDNEGSLVTEADGTPTEYWNENRIKALKDRFCCAIGELQKTDCNSCSI